MTLITSRQARHICHWLPGDRPFDGTADFADWDKRRIWKNKVTDTPKCSDKKDEYVILRSEQLVGTALIVLVKAHLTAAIRNVEATTRKTGLRGMSGNKGAVGIQLDYHDSSFCFLTAHLAAGHSNIQERTADYWTIVEGLHFLRGKTISSHDNVIWHADTNSRVDLENETVRSLALSDNLDALLAADQLKQVMDSKAAFFGSYSLPINVSTSTTWGRTTTTPAKKCGYQHGLGSQLDLTVYSRAELKSSDHQPVFATFRAEVRVIDKIKPDALSRMLLDNVACTVSGEKLYEKLASLTFYTNNIDLPPPSSDEAAWWDDPDPNDVFALRDTLSQQIPSIPPKIHHYQRHRHRLTMNSMLTHSNYKRPSHPHNRQENHPSTITSTK